MTEQKSLFLDTDFEEVQITPQPVTCLGMTFESDEARRAYFREELRKRLPELRKIEGFPIGEDDDIINLSDPPYNRVPADSGSHPSDTSRNRQKASRQKPE